MGGQVRLHLSHLTCRKRPSCVIAFQRRLLEIVLQQYCLLFLVLPYLPA